MGTKASGNIAAKREYLVVKANELVQKNRFELSLTEQKTVAFICSMIKPVKDSKEPYQLDYEFNIREYCKICGFNYDSGQNYADVKATLKKLRDRSMCLTLPDGSETLCGWLAKVTTNKRSGLAHVRIDEDLAPYLFDLGQRFTQYQLYNILAMKSAFSVRLYELMKSYAHRRNITLDLDELKHLLMVEDVKSYHRFPDFRRYVLEIAQREINELTDLTIQYEPIKKGNKIVQLRFEIEQKDSIERWLTEKQVNEQLDGM